MGMRPPLATARASCGSAGEFGSAGYTFGALCMHKPVFTLNKSQHTQTASLGCMSMWKESGACRSPRLSNLLHAVEATCR
jgi:hypothetical protein